MNGYFKASEHTQIRKKPQLRIRPPYDEIITKSLQGFVNVGLLTLKDIGNGVNYEDMCITIVSCIPRNYSMPEFIEYFQSWQMKFSIEKDDEERLKLFKKMIKDLAYKGLLPSVVYGLTSHFTGLVEKIQLDTSDKNPTH